MSQKLPTGGFYWDDNLTKYSEDYIKRMRDDDPEGCLLEVDLEYPQHLHDLHDQYPLAPEHLDVKREMLSQHQQDLADSLGVKIGGGEKLCLTLLNKKNYRCHYRNLRWICHAYVMYLMFDFIHIFRQYLNLGMKLKKVHRVLKFRQSAWISKYIALNTSLRQRAACKAEEDLPKLMNNSFFGKVGLHS